MNINARLQPVKANLDATGSPAPEPSGKDKAEEARRLAAELFPTLQEQEPPAKKKPPVRRRRAKAKIEPAMEDRVGEAIPIVVEAQVKAEGRAEPGTGENLVVTPEPASLRIETFPPEVKVEPAPRTRRSATNIILNPEGPPAAIRRRVEIDDLPASVAHGSEDNFAPVREPVFENGESIKIGPAIQEYSVPGFRVDLSGNQPPATGDVAAREVDTATAIRRNVLRVQLLGIIDEGTALIDEEIDANTDLTRDDKFILRLVRGNLRRAHLLLDVNWDALDAADKAERERELRDVKETLEDAPSWYERNRVNLAFLVSFAGLIRGFADDVVILLGG